ncbi:DNA topoisomerase [Leifsonia sp. NPDC102414]|uniref:DNA topoisomerase n=1 Tax=Leifsonia sp. NPDC102414 TaxID=3364124 RepID=UPI00382A4A3F
MTVLLVAEKPSAARNMAKALGGTMAGTFQGTHYEIVALRGHLYEYVEPHEQVAPHLSDKYKSWDLANLPWNPADLNWKRKPSAQSGVAEILQTLAGKARTASEVVVATDVDPSGEGGLLFAEPMLELGITPTKLTRMYFTDEAEASIQNAFLNRREIVGGLENFDEYKKALARSKFDWLTQQFTRVATVTAAQRAVLRQGRLKSAMLLLVGVQLKAHNEYVKKPFFENRFRDEHGVMYTNPDEPNFPNQESVAQTYAPSAVVVDVRGDKRVAPPRLLDLAALSSRLSAKGVKADQVLAIYQRMYEDQVVSYPRTEDKTITTEQFQDLLPLVDQIAALVDVDPALLTQRLPRRTHVKDEGAHGANRPGPNVPGSLDAIGQKYGDTGTLIYEELARSFLAMFAGDYVYESQQGHLEDWPTFIGSATVPKALGWKQVFADDTTDEPDDTETPNKDGLGTHAEPFVFEGKNKRPEHPTMKWLMKQLEKRDVGTGATRTSTYAEVTREPSDKNKWPLMTETRGKVTLTNYGDMGYRLLPGTRIGDLSLTERIYSEMRAVAAGNRSVEQVIAVVADWVTEDIQTMQANAATMRAELGLTEIQQKEKHEGTWAAQGGRLVSFNREWSGHRFTDQECQTLLDGHEITFTAISDKKKTAGAADPTFTARGSLAELNYKGKPWVGFKPEFSSDLPPDAWCQHTFTETEKETLLTGGTVSATDFVSQKGKPFSTTVRFGNEGGQRKIIPDFGATPRRTQRKGRRA